MPQRTRNGGGYETQKLENYILVNTCKEDWRKGGLLMLSCDFIYPSNLIQTRDDDPILRSRNREQILTDKQRPYKHRSGILSGEQGPGTILFIAPQHQCYQSSELTHFLYKNESTLLECGYMLSMPANLPGPWTPRTVNFFDFLLSPRLQSNSLRSEGQKLRWKGKTQDETTCDYFNVYLVCGALRFSSICGILQEIAYSYSGCLGDTATGFRDLVTCVALQRRFVSSRENDANQKWILSDGEIDVNVHTQRMDITDERRSLGPSPVPGREHVVFLHSIGGFMKTVFDVEAFVSNQAWDGKHMSMRNITFFLKEEQIYVRRM
ncbi:hypothetical protein C0J52_18862 [Blattella germanica]|nr:hypothetical protein C0J52_18862 [Blattella germanica]